MIDFESIKITKECGREDRKDYFDGILNLIEQKRAEAKEIRNRDFSPEAFAKNRESYRKKYIDMLKFV